MARDRANIRLDMWADQEWRDLSASAQHLYMLLLSHPTLSYAGVADWKPGRLAAMTRGRTRKQILAAAAELQEKLFIVVDEDSEEVLVRSFVKHDGLLKQPKMVVSMTNAYAAIASKIIREILAFEVQKLRKLEPGLKAWEVKQAQTLLKAKGTDIRTLTPGFTPPLTPGLTPNVEQTQGLPTSTSTSTSTKERDKSLSLAQRQVAKLLNLKDDDERLQSIPQMLKNQNVKNPTAWIRSLTIDDLQARLIEAHTQTLVAQQRALDIAARKCPHGIVNGKRTGNCEKCEAVA